MKEISATQFKEQCLALLDSVDREGIVITKRGKRVARLVAYDSSFGSLIGSLEGKLRINGDVLSTGVDWRVEP